MYKLNLIDKISIILVIAGALNWGAVGLFSVDIVEAIFGGSLQVFTRIIYILVGVSALNFLMMLIKLKNMKQ